MNKKNKIILTNLIITLMYSIIYLSILITTVVFGKKQIGDLLKLYDEKAYSNIFTFLIIITSLLIIFSIVQLISTLFADTNTFNNSKAQLIFLNVVSLNIVLLLINTIYWSILTKQNGDPHVKNWKSNLLNIIGIRKWNNLDYALIAIFCALSIVLGFMENYLPQLPYGGGFGLKYIPLVVLAFVHSYLASWIAGAVTALIGLLYIPANNIISPWSYMLDYFLPLTSPAIVAFFRFKVTNVKSFTTYINYLIIAFLTVSIIFIWQVLAGVAVWNVVFPDQIWVGYNKWTYSIIYNFIHNYLFTFPFMLLATPVLLRTLTPIYEKYTI